VRIFLISLIGKIVALATRVRGGHGSALPGLIMEKIDPRFLGKILGNLPFGVVVISGTNGKTTTTKMVTELLRANGLKVFTNPSGSNFTRGVASSALKQMKWGKLRADIAVLELDEAHAVHFVNKIAPKYSLLLNVFRDQLDRFGEIDTTAKFLEKIAEKTTGTVILNREDPLVSKIPARVKKYFGYSRVVAKLFPNDDELYGITDKKSNQPAEIILEKFENDVAEFNIGATKLQLGGAHNALNAVAALALVKTILDCSNKSGNDEVGIFNPEKMLRALSEIKPAFGRGESFVIDGQPLELNLVKNPSGFRIVIASQYNKNAATMIAINDHYSDGRDMSWLWDVDFSAVKSVDVVSGIRANDMALRLMCQDIKIGDINTNLRASLTQFLSQNPDTPKQIFATYTAMLEIRKILKKECRK
jgi:UDP-N-acetylmuramyl tripeptide synthase